MSLCKNSATITFTGLRADDGGQPEELTVDVTSICVTPPSPLFPVEDFDARSDVDFEFKPNTDGAYHVQFIGGVSGLIEEFDFLVTFHADNELGRTAKHNTKSVMEAQCVNEVYVLKSGLICLAQAAFDDGKPCDAEKLLLSVVDDCGQKIEDCGCC